LYRHSGRREVRRVLEQLGQEQSQIPDDLGGNRHIADLTEFDGTVSLDLGQR
jgi:hypothetical protein